jgi:hypothetical protein
MNSICRHCSRRIVLDNGLWVDPEATGDDSVWRETCDAHDTFIADHEPALTCDICAHPAQTIIHSSEGSGPSCLSCAPATRVEVIAFEHAMNAANWHLTHFDPEGEDMARQRRIDEAGRYKL